MPYLEILAPSAPEPRKRAASRALTDGVVEAFEVEPATVTLYFLPVALADYAHEGQLGHDGAGHGTRVFVKVHALPPHAGPAPGAGRRHHACAGDLLCHREPQRGRVFPRPRAR